MSREYVVLPQEGTDDLMLPVDTIKQIRHAKALMRAAGAEALRVYVGEPPDAYANGQILFAAPKGESA